MKPPETRARHTVWVPLVRLRRARVPARYLPWLLEEGSLTRRLLALCRERFRVAVVEQGYRRPLAEEATALGLAIGRFALVRQVRLLCDGEPWVCARTVIPSATLCGHQRRLAHLGNRSLGAVLFADPTMARGPIEVACVASSTPLHALVTAGLASPPPEVWGRRTLFWLQCKPLLVSEFFLPSVAEYPK
jgi:chorismate--pyruvate lyase